jgi:hypothetical protein
MYLDCTTTKEFKSCGTQETMKNQMDTGIAGRADGSAADLAAIISAGAWAAMAAAMAGAGAYTTAARL